MKTVPLRPGVLKVKAVQGDQSISRHLTSRCKEKSGGASGGVFLGVLLDLGSFGGFLGHGL